MLAERTVQAPDTFVHIPGLEMVDVPTTRYELSGVSFCYAVSYAPAALTEIMPSNVPLIDLARGCSALSNGRHSSGTPETRQNRLIYLGPSPSWLATRE